MAKRSTNVVWVQRSKRSQLGRSKKVTKKWDLKWAQKIESVLRKKGKDGGTLGGNYSMKKAKRDIVKNSR